MNHYLNLMNLKYADYIKNNGKEPKYLIINGRYKKMLEIYCKTVLREPEHKHVEKFMGCLLCSPCGDFDGFEFAS